MLTLTTHQVREVLSLSKGGVFNRLEALTPVATGKQRLSIYATSDVLTTLGAARGRNDRHRAQDLITASSIHGDGLYVGCGGASAERGRQLVLWCDPSQMGRLWEAQRNLANGLASSLTSNELMSFMPGLNFKLILAPAIMKYVITGDDKDYREIAWRLYAPAFVLVNSGGDIETNTSEPIFEAA